MKFNLNYTPAKPDFEISHHHTLVLIGSCFSENIGHLLRQHKFNTLSNPGGTLFNPLSVVNHLNNALNNTHVAANSLLKRGERHYSFLHHSSINADTSQDLVDLISQNQKNTLAQLKSAHYLFITFGTAFYYHHRALNLVVANCHKQPLASFEKRTVSVDEVVSQYTYLFGNLKKINPRIKIIFTVSPVKHLRDGLIENNRSKAVLLLSAHRLVETHQDCYYFPAFELVNDDLRDYRFYKEDLAHPNEQAINYVWEKFSETYFNQQTQSLNKLIQKFNAAISHRNLLTNQGEAAKLKQHIASLKDQIEKEFKVAGI